MRVVNSLLVEDNQMLLLYKPSRNKWFLPGGKAEFGEDVVTTGCREFVEETGLSLEEASLKSVTTIVVLDELEQKEWLLFTLKSSQSTGELVNETREGTLKWHPIDAVKTLPMFEGDRYIINHLLESDEVICTSQTYTPTYELIKLNVNNLK